MKKKIFAIVLCLIMAVALAIPAFATQSNVARAPVVGIPYFLACWNGQRDASGNMMVLRGNGMNATMTTNIMRLSIFIEFSKPVFTMSVKGIGMIIQRPVVISVSPLMAHRFISQTHWSVAHGICKQIVLHCRLVP